MLARFSRQISRASLRLSSAAQTEPNLIVEKLEGDDEGRFDKKTFRGLIFLCFFVS